jgi:hypothetical protein
MAWLVGDRRLRVRYERRADILLGLLQELGRLGGRGRAVSVVEQLPAGQVADGRLVGGKQPRQGGHGWIITRAVHGGVIAEPDANRAAATKNRPKVGNTLSVRCGWVP